MTLLEKEKPKVIVILNFYSQSVDLLDYPEEIEDKVTNEYEGDLESYLDEKHGYPTSNICYMQTTWENLKDCIAFAIPKNEQARLDRIAGFKLKKIKLRP